MRPQPAPSAGGNGVYKLWHELVPECVVSGENYWVDVIIGPLDTTPPTVSNHRTHERRRGVGHCVDHGGGGGQHRRRGRAVQVGRRQPRRRRHGKPLHDQLEYGERQQCHARVGGSGPRYGRQHDDVGAVSVSVFNADTFPPTVSITAPASGAALVGTVNVYGNRLG